MFWQKTKGDLLQKNQIPSEIQIGTGVGILVILLISLAAAIYIASYENNLVIQEHQNSQYLEAIVNTMPNEDQSNNQEKDVVIQIDEPTEQWKTCRNEKAGYEVKYPSEWEIGDRGPFGFEILQKCSSSRVFFSPEVNVSDAGNLFFVIDTVDAGNGTGMVYQGSGSVDEYLQRRGIEKEIMKKTQLLGETVFWFADNSVLLLHDGTIFDIQSSGFDEKSFINFLSTLKFLR